MTHDIRTSELIYQRLKTAVLTSSIGDQARLDFAELAQGFGVSTTPVREAAMRLLGEGVLEFSAKGSLRPRRLSEARLRVLLEAHATITLTLVNAARLTDRTDDLWSVATDNAQRARIVFRELARRSRNPELEEIVERLSDRLMPYRLHEERVIGDTGKELEAMWAARADATMLRRLVRAYHRRRMALVAKLAWVSLATDEANSTEA